MQEFDLTSKYAAKFQKWFKWNKFNHDHILNELQDWLWQKKMTQRIWNAYCLVHSVRGKLDMYILDHLDSDSMAFRWYNFGLLDNVGVDGLDHTKLCNVDRAMYDHSDNELVHIFFHPKGYRLGIVEPAQCWIHPQYRSNTRPCSTNAHCLIYTLLRICNVVQFQRFSLDILTDRLPNKSKVIIQLFLMNLFDKTENQAEIHRWNQLKINSSSFTYGMLMVISFSFLAHAVREHT